MKKGFTLVELLIVVLIIGILATIATPLYRKTIETSKATNALSLLNAIANANKMFWLDNGSYTTGKVDDNHPLVKNVYVSTRGEWNTDQWKYCACNTVNCGQCGGPCPGNGIIACAWNNSPLGAPYNTWRFEIQANGTCMAYGTNNIGCPSN
ncbi:MAG: prepilin-type N-terminal cleavage/methylation domain-containing protein [Elusimicrobiota bacterium]